MFGLQWQAMIQGLAFMSHQLGSFMGAYGGGLIYDALGSYNMAWRIGVALGLAGGIHPGRVRADPAERAAVGQGGLIQKQKRGRKAPFEVSSAPRFYLILDSRKFDVLCARPDRTSS